MLLIDYKNVNIYQDAQLVLKDVNFSVGEGEFVYITGKVGSGKSSLLKSVYAEIPIKEGSANVLDIDVKKLKQKNVPELRRKLGIIFQDFQLLTDRNVEANLRFVLKATGWKNKRDMDQRIKEVLELVGMNTKGYKMPNELSGGEQQRVTIARAILNNPKLILADEPTGNLDVETSNRITELLQSISKAGSTVIMITHNMNLLTRYPGRVFKCEGHQFSEVTTPEAFDLSTFEEEGMTPSEDSNEGEDNAEGSPVPAIEIVQDNDSTIKVDTVVPETQISAEEAEAIASMASNVVETTAESAESATSATATATPLLPIEGLDDYQPHDITAINEIIKEHENGGKKNEEVID